MDINDEIEEIMTCQPIPTGQLRIFKALWDTHNTGLSFSRLARTTHGDGDAICDSLISLGERVKDVIDRPLSVPSRVIIARTGDGCYFLTDEVMDFIEATPSLKGALDKSQQQMFDLDAPVSYQFIWDEDKKTGRLEQFAR